MGSTIEHSALLDIPPEIRLIIYDCIFDALPSTYRKSKDFKDLEPTSLFQVCRQIRAEAVPKYKQWMQANAHAVLSERIRSRPVTILPSMTPQQQLTAAVKATKRTLTTVEKKLNAILKFVLLKQRSMGRLMAPSVTGADSKAKTRKLNLTGVY